MVRLLNGIDGHEVAGGRMQGEPFHVAVEAARNEQRRFEHGSHGVVIFRWNENRLHHVGISRSLREAPAPRALTAN